MDNASHPQPGDSESERRVMLLAGDLAHPAWEAVEKAYARGQTLAEAKQAVLEREIARLAASTEGPVLDRVVQLVMQTPASGLRPAARQRHRKVVLERLLEPYRAAGGSEPGTISMLLYRRFGIVPGALRAFWLSRGERLRRVT